MKFKLSIYSRLIVGSFAALLVIGTARPSTVTGSIFENNPTGAGNAVPANVPTTASDITFTTSTPINFFSGNLYTIREFLSSGSGSAVLTGANHLGDTLYNTLFNFTGTVSVTTGETFTAGHDDGLTLIIDNITVINTPGPTGFTLTNRYL